MGHWFVTLKRKDLFSILLIVLFTALFVISFSPFVDKWVMVNIDLYWRPVFQIGYIILYVIVMTSALLLQRMSKN